MTMRMVLMSPHPLYHPKTSQMKVRQYIHTYTGSIHTHTQAIANTLCFTALLMNPALEQAKTSPHNSQATTSLDKSTCNLHLSPLTLFQTLATCLILTLTRHP